MAREYAKDILKKLGKISDVRLIYVHAPFEETLYRIPRRNQATHVKWTHEELRQIYDSCENLDLDFDLRIDNSESPTEETIVSQLKPLFEERKWFDDHVEILFRGQAIKFKCWSGVSLTEYDMDYKPWKVSFREENPQYLKYYGLNVGDTVIDAGGYKGTFTAYASKVVGKNGRIITFEPDYENFKDLQETVALNKLTNVTLLNKALWSKERTLKFNSKHTAGASFFFNAGPHAKDVQAVTLDAELGRLGVEKVDFIKMDIEGSEIEALNGSKRTLGSNDINMSVASYHVVGGQETSETVEETLSHFGYETWTEFPNHKITYGRRGAR